LAQHSQRSILLFWGPLAATWVMMASEGPFLAAIIARSADATYNLAAHGVAWALAILVEAPVIMLMSAATALVRDRTSYLKLRAFSRALALGTTSILLVLLVPPVYRWLTGTVMGLPSEVADLTYGALWFFLPWPSAIAYRRFLQGVLIRSGKTRLVAYGTVLRLAAMSAAALVGFLVLELPGAWVGGLALSTGVIAEAGVARLMAASTVRDLLAGRLDQPHAPTIRYREIASFYLPLALTSLIGLTVQPMLTFFMGRSVSPVESLAVFPVVHALSFFFRSLALAFQDAAIALVGERLEHLPELRHERRPRRRRAHAPLGRLLRHALGPLRRAHVVCARAGAPARAAPGAHRAPLAPALHPRADPANPSHHGRERHRGGDDRRHVHGARLGARPRRCHRRLRRVRRGPGARERLPLARVPKRPHWRPRLTRGRS